MFTEGSLNVHWMLVEDIFFGLTFAVRSILRSTRVSAV
jgi:hypothetical protein